MAYSIGICETVSILSEEYTGKLSLVLSLKSKQKRLMETQICYPPAYSGGRGAGRAQERNSGLGQHSLCLGESCLSTSPTDARPCRSSPQSLAPLKHSPSTGAQSSSEIESLVEGRDGKGGAGVFSSLSVAGMSMVLKSKFKTAWQVEKKKKAKNRPGRTFLLHEQTVW